MFPLLQFKKSPPKVPYKAIALATVLFLIGSLLIVIGALLLAGYFGVTVSTFFTTEKNQYVRLVFTELTQMFSLFQDSDRTVPVLIIGLLVFLPGIYHLRIAYYASKGYPGYSYDDIPDFDDWPTPYLQPQSWCAYTRSCSVVRLLNLKQAYRWRKVGLLFFCKWQCYAYS